MRASDVGANISIKKKRRDKLTSLLRVTIRGKSAIKKKHPISPQLVRFIPTVAFYGRSRAFLISAIIVFHALRGSACIRAGVKGRAGSPVCAFTAKENIVLQRHRGEREKKGKSEKERERERRNRERARLLAMVKATGPPRPLARNLRRFTLSLPSSDHPENTETLQCVPWGNRSLAVSFAVNRRRKGRIPDQTRPGISTANCVFRREGSIQYARDMDVQSDGSSDRFDLRNSVASLQIWKMIRACRPDAMNVAGDNSRDLQDKLNPPG